MRIQSLSGAWQLRRVGTDETWLPAVVPGGVHTDLMAAGPIPDPFVADNEKRVQWVAESDWEYRRTFAVDPQVLTEQHIFLVCDGLDTLAEVTLNGQHLGGTANMFRQYRWEIKPYLREDDNELLIHFRSPVQYISARQQERPMHGVVQAIPGGPYLRKAPCQFGWDWGPKLPPIGIWKDTRLEGRSVARLDDVHLRQHHAGGTVTVEATLSVERWRDVPLVAEVRATAPDGEVFESRTVIDEGIGVTQVPIPRPQLWWPNGYPASPCGDSAQSAAADRTLVEQPLYRVEVRLRANDRVCDRRTYQIGLRTVELRQEQDAWGQSFTFVINGVPIFAKGSNWIPADSFPTRISDAHLEQLIHDGAATHHNMLRVWGGGFYEDDRFYDLCDRYGILVWQDFVFSCSIYPLADPLFLENVRVEVIQNVRRLRHRASLALWCGNNEMEWGWVSWGWSVPGLVDLKAAYKQFFHQTLPEWCAAEDPDNPYWPSSPSSGVPFQDPNGVERGDAHYWEVWHGGLPFAAYRDQYPRFMSEFGFQSLPPVPTIRTYADESEWNMMSYVMEYHQRSAGGNGRIITQMTDHFRLPKDFESLVYVSQVLQAEAIRMGVEHWRRNRHRTSGTLYWQLNDCWPVASWSSIDYFGRWKALHYAARRFYAPALLSLEGSSEDGQARVGVHVISDMIEPWDGTVRWSLENLRGEVLEKGREALSVAPLTSTRVCALDFTHHITDDNRRELVFLCELWQEHRRIALSTVTFVPDKHLSLCDPELGVDVRQDGDQLTVALTAGSLARFVELALAGVDVVFSDNFFDVPAGRTVAVTCPLLGGWTIEQTRATLRVRSLYDSFA